MVKDEVISGIVCEFNPFHNGHRYLLEQVKARNSGYLVCVMSGNYVQRGECALLDKWARTECALENGADLVLELPLPFAVSGAETFARGGVQVLQGLGGVDILAFGSESGEVEPLLRCAEFLLSPQFREEIKKRANGPVTFARARSEAVAAVLGDEYAALLQESNNILGIEYLKALQGSGLTPFTVKRHMAGHKEGSRGQFASASFLRSQIRSGGEFRPFVPKASAALLETSPFARMELAERAVLYKLRTMTPQELLRVPDVGEGLENKLLQAAGTSASLEELYSSVKSKRYSHARIRRAVLSAFLGLEKRHTAHVPYLRVLGLNGNGEKILRNGAHSLPLVCSYGDVKKLDDSCRELFSLEARADDLYGLMRDPVTASGTDYTTRIIKR